VFQFLFESTPGIQTFAIIALFIFFVFFTIALIWAIRTDNAYINHLKYLPFDLDNQDGDKNHDKNEE